jgi:CRISPR-associated protein Csy3
MESDKQETIVEVIKNGIVDKTFTFDSSDFDLSNFDVDNKDLEELANMICEAFTGESGLLLNVKSFCYMGNGQDVFPSEEFIQDKAKAKKGDKSKQLFSLDGQAALHSQKIGNAIRTIDTWYSEYDERLVPISAECYGAVTTLGRAFRSKENFYTLLDGWILKDNELTDEQKHFVISILIRGGVFGESSKE